VASIAAGKDPHFRGVAPQAELLIVQSNMVDTPYALDWILGQAANMGRPVVVNWSLGHHYGPHDGTHIIERHIGSVVGPGKLVVAAAGNSGRSNVHATYQVHSPGEEFQMDFVIDESTRRFVLTAWYAQDDDFDVELLHLPQMPLPVPISGEPTKYHRFGEAEVSVLRGAYSYSGLTQLECCIDLPKSPGKDDLEGWALHFHARRVNTGRVHAWIVHDDFGQFRDNSLLSRESTLTIPGTSEHVITVGSFASTDHWETDGGIGQDPTTTPGSISRFSSRGPRPTWTEPDFTHKPDLVAPGEWITAALSSTAARRPRQECQSKRLYTGRGTSQAAPLISGLVALMLEAKGNLTVSQTRAILKETATRDDCTGAGQDGSDSGYGFGKVNASAALAQVREIE
jgi:subtilisin family serine protease